MTPQISKKDKELWNEIQYCISMRLGEAMNEDLEELVDYFADKVYDNIIPYIELSAKLIEKKLHWRLQSDLL